MEQINEKGQNMDLAEQFWYAWPWMGLGAAVVMMVLLFCTDLLRSDGGGRWLDPVWLAWLAVPVYLLHQFEEYACNLADGEYLIIGQVFANAGDIMDLSQLPLAFFPEVNILLVWVTVPISAYLCGRNPVIGLAPYGFIFVNGLMHCVGSLTGLMPIALNPGFWTGTFVFLPLVALVVYATFKRRFMSGGALAVAFVAGAISHVFFAMGYVVSAFVGGGAALVVGGIGVFSSIFFAWLGCKVFHVRYVSSEDNAPND